MATNTTDILDNIAHIIYLCYSNLLSVSGQFILLGSQLISWWLTVCSYGVIVWLKWTALAISACLRLIETIATEASQMNRRSDGRLLYAFMIGFVLCVAALLAIITFSRKPTPRRTYPSRSTIVARPDVTRPTYTKSYTTPISSAVTRPTYTKSYTTPAQPAPSQPTYRTPQRSRSYFFRSFNPDEYSSILRELDDERLRRESETVLSSLGANVGSTALHWSHAAASAGLTAPLSVAATVVSGRKGYVNKRKLKLVEDELNSRMLRAKFGARGIAKIAGKSIFTAATMGMHSDS